MVESSDKWNEVMPGPTAELGIRGKWETVLEGREHQNVFGDFGDVRLWVQHASEQCRIYEEFLKEIYLSYPEIKSERAGTIDLLQKLCKWNRGITVKEEGRLKRFGEKETMGLAVK
jgi:hypothetical protein